MNEIQKKNKELCELYPYLIVRNLWTDKIPEDYDYSYIRGIGEVPCGWEKLFMQLCKDIRQPLIEDNYLNKFRFTQIKEKYNQLRTYHNGASNEVNDILNKYEYVSQFICQKCGKPANYETQGWYASYCNECIDKLGINKSHCEPIKFEPIMVVNRYEPSKDSEKGYVKRVTETDVSDIWNRLYDEGK